MDIIVTGKRYRDWTVFGHSYTYYTDGGDIGRQPIDGESGGGGYYDQTDQSAESPYPSIDLTDTTNFYITIGGKNIRVIIDNKTAPPGSPAYQRTYEVLGKLAASFDYLSSSAKEAIMALDKIIVVDIKKADGTPLNRSFSEEARGSFFFDASELIGYGESSLALAASAILHDARHIHMYAETGDLNQSRGVRAETDAINLQLDNREGLGLSLEDVRFLEAWRDNPTAVQERVDTTPY
jgi:hypothetical protein